jgi:hypothetical protein
VVFSTDLSLRESPSRLAIAWGNRFWSLVPFAMQMVMIIIGGYVVASTPLVYVVPVQPHHEKVGDHAATVLWATTKGQPPVKLYFDPQSGLLVRMVHYTDTARGLNPVQVDYAHYRDVGGAKTPYRWTIARPSGALTIQLDEVHDNAPIDTAKFEKPAQTASAPGSPFDHRKVVAHRRALHTMSASKLG